MRLDSSSQTASGVPIRSLAVIFAGRYAERLHRTSLPKDCRIFAEGDDPHTLAAALYEASALVVLDPRSFPLEALAESNRDVPLAVIPDSLEDTPLFEQIGFFDLVAAPDSAAWRDLRKTRGWAECQRVDPGAEDPAELSARLVETFHKAPNLRYHKAMHLVREEAMKRHFAVASGDKPPDVLEISVGDGRWAASLDPAKTRYAGLAASEENLQTARKNFPDLRFDPIEADASFPHRDESFDVVFGVDSLQDEPPEARKLLISEMWRVARPGGHLVFLEDFVFEKPTEKKIPPMTAPEFAGLAMEAAANRVILDHMESFRYPGEDMVRGGVVSLLRLGSARTA